MNISSLEFISATSSIFQHQIKMAQIKYQNRKPRISKSRAAKASFLTGAIVIFVIVFTYHLVWAVKALYGKRFGSTLNTVVIAVGSLVVHFAATTSFLMFLETRWLSNHIDADHKKYI